MDMLSAVRRLDPPDGAIGPARLGRSYGIDCMGYEEPTPFRDVDVAYFDPSDLSAQGEYDLERKLMSSAPNVPGRSRTRRRRGPEHEPPNLSGAQL
jgi:hypothetical protein